MLIPVELPLKEESLIFKVYDYEDVLADELCCSVFMDLKGMLKYDISQNMQKKSKWVNLYGAPMGYSG